MDDDDDDDEMTYLGINSSVFVPAFLFSLLSHLVDFKNCIVYTRNNKMEQTGLTSCMPYMSISRRAYRTSPGDCIPVAR
jgi:hypothetical protein